MLWFNVHTVPADKIEKLLNDHTKKGYELRYIRNTGNRAKGGEQLVQLILQKEIPLDAGWEQAYEKRYAPHPDFDLRGTIPPKGEPTP